MIENNKKTNFYNQTWRLNHIYKILDKNKKEITFKMNKAQQFLRYIKRLDKKNRGCVRIIVLKARQHWITTYECLEKLDKALFYSNRNLKLSAHNEKKAIEIFEIIKFAYNRLPWKIILKNWVEWRRPKTKYMTKSSIRFLETNSRIEVVLDTRSGTPSDVHITELAFADNAKDMIIWTLPSIPKTWNFTIESTANWAGGQFYEMRKKNYQNPKWTFTCIFFPRFIAQEYRTALEPWEVIELPQDLKHLEKYWLDDEQLKWYIQQYFDLWEKVFQEFPSNPEEAFLSSWRLFFNMWIVKRLLDLEYEVDTKYRQKECQLRRYKKIDVSNPIEDALFWVDTAEWLPDWDFCSIKVRSRKDLSLICSFKWRIPPDELCDVIEHIIDCWVSWLIWIERNNTWLVTLKEAKDRWWYQMLYRTTIEDQATRKKTKKVGFSTTAQSRPLILGEIEKLIRQWHLKEIDDREKTEMWWFVYNDSWKPEASEWFHDDDIMADAICCYMNNEPQQIIISDEIEKEVEFNKAFL